mmetsp:Transcript_17364/g.25746  ORF Transcript_17364/g.25746 Transcript_17364/m.25746 type:complete len:147 (-) Transcript_17364:81-521(-)
MKSTSTTGASGNISRSSSATLLLLSMSLSSTPSEPFETLDFFFGRRVLEIQIVFVHQVIIIVIVDFIIVLQSQRIDFLVQRQFLSVLTFLSENLSDRAEPTPCKRAAQLVVHRRSEDSWFLKSREESFCRLNKNGADKVHECENRY